MHDETKNRGQLLAELFELRKRVSQFEHERVGPRQAEESLPDGEVRFGDLVTAGSDIVYRMSPDWKQMLYLRGREFVSETGTASDIWLEKHIYPDDRPKVLAAIQEAIRDKTIFEFEHRTLRADGSLGWTFSRAVPLLGPTGEIREWFGTAGDITEGKKMEEQLRENEAKYRAIVEAFDGFIYVCSSDYRIEYMNGPLIARTGFDATGELCFKTMHNRSEVCPWCVNERVFGGETVRWEVESPKDKRWYYVVNAPLYHSNGTVSKQVMITDVNARKQMEGELGELSQRLSYHVDHSPLAVIEWGHDMRLIRWSGEAERMFGWRAEEVIGKRMEDFRWIYEEDQSQVAEVSSDLKSGANPKRFSSNRNYRKDGSIIHCEWYNSSLMDDSGELRSILSLVLDVTERKRMEEALQKSRNELERRVKERTVDLKSANEKLRMVPSLLIEGQENERHRLAGDLHDSIGQTLAAIKFRIEHVIDTLGKGEYAQGLNLLNDFVPILQRSLDETRAIYMGLKPTILAEYGILATLEWYRRELLKLYPNQHIELETIIEEGDIPEGFKIAIFRIAQEALNNAFKHGKPEWVDVRLSLNGGTIELAISDDGVGMDLDYIMESRTAKSLGLIGMRERAELTGGAFTIESAPGDGTTVKACWPIGQPTKLS